MRILPPTCNTRGFVTFLAGVVEYVSRALLPHRNSSNALGVLAGEAVRRRLGPKELPCNKCR